MLSLVSQDPARGSARLQKKLTVRWRSSRSPRPRATIRRLSARSPQRYIYCPRITWEFALVHVTVADVS